MDDVELGRRFRVLRHRLGWRQSDVGARAGLSQDAVSRVETGKLSAVPLSTLRKQAAALGAVLRVELDFRGGELDRLMDEGHATLVGAVMARLEALGWEVRPEVSFAVFGERGSIDVVAWHQDTRTLLVVEVKTELISMEETLRRLDTKVRLVASIVEERFGWLPLRVARLLILPDTSTARGQAGRHEAILRSPFPTRGTSLRAWLREPSGSIRGLAFLPFTRGVRGNRPAAARKRVRRPRPSARDAGPPVATYGFRAEYAADASSVREERPIRTDDARDAQDARNRIPQSCSTRPARTR